MEFYICEHCGNIVEMIHDSGVPIMCCGQKMTRLEPGTTDAAVEKHVPVFKTDGSKVSVQIGEVIHPMVEEHFIQWIAIETKKGTQRKTLKAGDEPKATFALTDDDELIAVYAYCNLHGLWKAQ